MKALVLEGCHIYRNELIGAGQHVGVFVGAALLGSALIWKARK